MADTPRNVRTEPGDRRRVTYALETLYEHQDFDWVIDTIPHVLAWIASGTAGDQRPGLVFRLTVALPSGATPEQMEIALIWSVDALEQRDVALRAKVERLCSHRTVDRERIPENAA